MRQYVRCGRCQNFENRIRFDCIVKFALHLVIFLCNVVLHFPVLLMRFGPAYFRHNDDQGDGDLRLVFNLDIVFRHELLTIGSFLITWLNRLYSCSLSL